MTSSMRHNARIVLTDATCVLNEAVYEDIPTIVWPEGIDEASSDWLRALVVEFGVLPSSALGMR